jgi:hypothetical protein
MFDGMSKPTLVVAALIGGLALFVAGFIIAAEMRSAVASPALNGKILFQSDRDGDYEIYTINPDGTGETQITDNTASDSWAAWSPDGSKIVFTSNRDGNTEIYYMNADGTSPTRVTNNTVSDGMPDWQPLPGSVGGIGELPNVAGTGDPLPRNQIIMAAVTAMIAFGAGAFYARRRWSRGS